MNCFRIGTRKSPLALAQTQLVSERLRQAYPDIPVTVVPCITRGDVNLRAPLSDFGGKGAFVSEIEEMLIAGRIDLAVHSAKDLPDDIHPGTEIISMLPREDPSEVLLALKNSAGDPGIIGTSSPRRQMLVKKFFPDAQCKLLRGNVSTRIERLRSFEYDGILLALAGIKRLGLDHDPDLDYRIFNPREFLPAAGQGIIAAQFLRDGAPAPLLRPLIHEQSHRQLLLERTVLKGLGAGCHDAAGVYTEFKNGAADITVLLERAGKQRSCRFSASDLHPDSIKQQLRSMMGL
ncbi:hydroxymethylbilane synthase [Succinimonas sp.]|uniref:hydroxymethylbilane synthase n=1 Tax=Succinimonas sp. TaxID=1936151 RepID=UPI00386A9F18